MLYSDILSMIGNTPLVELQRFSPRPGIRLFAKLEGQNPTGSVKDRIAAAMVEDAEKRGVLTPDKILLEPTSGNTGIALAMIARHKGYKLVAVMPDNVSVERRTLLEMYGAEIVLTDGAMGSNGSIFHAQEMAKDSKYLMLYQYGNEANPGAHCSGTAEEIIRDLPEVTMFVAGLGTGGTLTGVGRRLKKHNPSIQIVAAEPHAGDLVQGLRSLDEGFIPPVLDLDILDRKIMVRGEDGIKFVRELAVREGIFAGLSSGAALAVALRATERLESANVVVLFADGGWKYLSTGAYTGEAEAAAEGLRGKAWM
jgi:cysteine synthase B